MLTLIDRETGRPAIHDSAVAQTRLEERGHVSWRVDPGVGAVCNHCGHSALDLTLGIAVALDPRALIREL